MAWAKKKPRPKEADDLLQVLDDLVENLSTLIPDAQQEAITVITRRCLWPQEICLGGALLPGAAWPSTEQGLTRKGIGWTIVVETHGIGQIQTGVVRIHCGRHWTKWTVRRHTLDYHRADMVAWLRDYVDTATSRFLADQLEAGGEHDSDI